MVALCAVQFVDVLGVTVVVTALPQMLRGVGASASRGSLVATGYAMFFGGLLMFGARLGDRFGHRRTILASLLVFAAGVVLAAMSTTVAVLTAARCLQGAAAAGAVPSALRLLTSVVHSEQARARVVAAWSASGAAAGASGFVLGGVVTDLVGWRWIFWALVAVAVVLAGAVFRLVPDDGPGDRSRALNPTSSALLTAAVMAVVVGTTLVAVADRRGVGVALLLVGVVLAAVLRWSDGRSAAPLLPTAILAQPTLRRGALAAGLNTATTSSAVTLLTLYVQDTLGRAPLAVAAILLPFSVCVVAGSAFAAPVIRAVRRERTVAAGLAMIAAADGCLIGVARHLPLIGVCMAAAGVGIGLSSVAATSLGTDIPEHDRATASGLINTTAQVGTAIGIASLLLLAVATTGTPAPGTSPPWPGWAMAAVTAIAGGIGFLILTPSQRGPTQSAGRHDHSRPRKPRQKV